MWTLKDEYFSLVALAAWAKALRPRCLILRRGSLEHFAVGFYRLLRVARQ